MDWTDHIMWIFSATLGEGIELVSLILSVARKLQETVKIH
jgi:hypothetical protein